MGINDPRNLENRTVAYEQLQKYFGNNTKILSWEDINMKEAKKNSIKEAKS